MAYEHSDFSLYPLNIIVDNIKYDYTPSVDFIADQVAGIQRQSILTADLSRAVSFVKPFDVPVWRTSTDIYPAENYEFAQVMKLSWDDFISETMYDHLVTLFRTQKGFWLQYDSEMSRENLVLSPSVSDDKVYVLPTYPLAYQSEATNASLDKKVMIALYEDGDLIDWADNPYRIDHERGIIKFTSAIAGELSCSYVWRMYVRLVMLELQPISENGLLYSGSVTVEQIKPPRQVGEYSADYIPEQYKCGDEVAFYGTDVKSDALSCLSTYVENTDDNLEYICEGCTHTKLGLADITTLSFTPTAIGLSAQLQVNLSSIPSAEQVVGIRLTKLNTAIASYAATNESLTAAVGMRFVATGGSYVVLSKVGLPNTRQNLAIFPSNTENGTIYFGSCNSLFTTSFGTLTTSQIKQGLQFSITVAISGSSSGIKPKYYLGLDVTGSTRSIDSGGSQTSTAISTSNTTQSVTTLSSPFNLTLTPSNITTPSSGRVFAESILGSTYRLVYQNPNYPAAVAGLNKVALTYTIRSYVYHTPSGSGLSSYSDFIDIPTPATDITASSGGANTVYAQQYVVTYDFNGMFEQNYGNFNTSSRGDIVPHGTTSPVYDRAASITYAQEIKAAMLSELLDFEVEVIHRSICRSNKESLETYTSTGGGTTSTGSTPHTGPGRFITTDTTHVVTGPGTLALLVDGADFSYISDTAKVVGMSVEFEASDTETRTLSVGLYRGSAGAPTFTGKTVSVGNAMTKFTLGGSNDRWGASYFTKADLTDLGVTFSGITLDTGEIFKLKNVKVQIHYLTECC